MNGKFYSSNMFRATFLSNKVCNRNIRSSSGPPTNMTLGLTSSTRLPSSGSPPTLTGSSTNTTPAHQSDLCTTTVFKVGCNQTKEQILAKTFPNIFGRPDRMERINKDLSCYKSPKTQTSFTRLNYQSIYLLLGRE